LTDFRQTFVTGASWDTDDLITFLGQKVKVQGHTIAAEAHSTLRYRRVQLFLVNLEDNEDYYNRCTAFIARWFLPTTDTEQPLQLLATVHYTAIINA